MGTVQPFRPHLLIAGVLSALPSAEQEAEEALTRRFGPILRRTEKIDFTFTRYYAREMGESLQRFYLVFQNPVQPDELAGIKGFTQEIEQRLSRDGNRVINIDPGLLSPGRLILATVKDREHRIPLKDGIYGEVTLIYMHGTYEPLPWTYADYREESVRQFFSEVRRDMSEVLKQ